MKHIFSYTPLPLAGLTLSAWIVATAPLYAVESAGSRAMPPATAPTSAAPARMEESYTLGPGDRVRIEVFKLQQYNLETQVLVDGTLSLLQVGKVPVQGLTLAEASEAASQKYAKLLKYPLVTVTLISPRPVKVGVSGEVKRRGSFLLSTAETGSQLPTLTKAISTAGGITQTADIRRVQLRRLQPNGASQVINVDLWDFLQTGDLSRDIVLRDGDSIFIPTASEVNLAESAQLATTSFSADKAEPLNIAVVGEVYRPGPYTVTSSTRTREAGVPGDKDTNFNNPETVPTLTRAIQVAGGIKPLADVRQIQVRRTTKAGTEQVFTVDLWKLLKEGDLKQDLILQDRDTITIPTATSISAQEAAQVASASFSPNTIRVNVVGEVEKPGVIEVPPNTPLNQAILAAGGFNRRAKNSSVELIRLNPDSTVSRRDVSVNFAQNINEKGNPGLRNDDVIVVKRSGISKLADTLGTVLSPLNPFGGGFLLIDRLFR
jgi:polysaccharide biosynthesis/export protein